MARLIAQVKAQVNPAQDLQAQMAYFFPYIRAIKATFLERAKGSGENL